MTKHNLRFIGFAFALLLGIASTAYAGVPPMKVTVFDASGKVAYQGATGANATFATTNLRPGNYVVQFNSNSRAVPGQHYLLVASAGKKKVIADAVPGEKFTGGGAAMRISVGPGLKITGQIAREQAVASGGNANVKVINGTRYVWVEAATGSNLGGHWEEEGLPGAIHVASMSLGKLRQLQDRAGEGSMFGPHLPHPDDH